VTLKIEHLHVALDGTGVLRDVGLRVGEGELVCLVGRNGAGKTTTFRSIMGFVRPTRGDITWRGQSLIGLPTYSIARLGLGYTPEGSEVFGELTVADNIALPTWSRKTGATTESRTAKAYAVFPALEKYRERGAMQLSGGERKMVSIARAMALDPQLLLLDEAFEGLSPALLPTISDGLHRILSQGRSILLAESNYYHLPSFAHRIYIVERGEVVFEGTQSQVRADPAALKLINGTA
jgi:branched-chain amino acid transport system ATP-binding protein